MDSQLLAIFDSLRDEDDEFRDTFREQLRQATNWEFAELAPHAAYHLGTIRQIARIVSSSA